MRWRAWGRAAVAGPGRPAPHGSWPLPSAFPPASAPPPPVPAGSPGPPSLPTPQGSDLQPYSSPGPGPQDGPRLGHVPWLARSSPSWWERAASSRSCPLLWALALALLSSAERGRRGRDAKLLRLSGPDPPLAQHSARRLTTKLALHIHPPSAARGDPDVPRSLPPPPPRLRPRQAGGLPGNVVQPPEASWEL